MNGFSNSFKDKGMSNIADNFSLGNQSSGQEKLLKNNMNDNNNNKMMNNIYEFSNRKNRESNKNLQNYSNLIGSASISSENNFANSNNDLNNFNTINNNSANVYNSHSTNNINEHLSNLDLSLNKNSDPNNIININESELDRHISLWENLFDIETNSDNKQVLSIHVKKFLQQLSDEIVKKNLNFEIFSNSAFNKSYAKIFKVACIIMVYVKFILIDFNFENNIKSNLKKISNVLNENLLNLLDNLILGKDNAGIMKRIKKNF
jgi:hypothetical protein